PLRSSHPCPACQAFSPAYESNLSAAPTEASGKTWESPAQAQAAVTTEQTADRPEPPTWTRTRTPEPPAHLTLANYQVAVWEVRRLEVAVSELGRPESPIKQMAGSLQKLPAPRPVATLNYRACHCQFRALQFQTLR